jgi:hypothetical protein
MSGHGKLAGIWRRLTGGLDAGGPADAGIADGRVASLHNVPQHDLQDPARGDPNPLDRKRRMAALFNRPAGVSVFRRRSCGA